MADRGTRVRMPAPKAPKPHDLESVNGARKAWKEAPEAEKEALRATIEEKHPDLLLDRRRD